MAELTQDIINRIEELERLFKYHLGPQSGATSLNHPHNGVPYLNSSHEIDIGVIPTGTSSSTVAAGDHEHTTGYYL
jgi:hypothetical protein